MSARPRTTRKGLSHDFGATSLKLDLAHLLFVIELRAKLRCRRGIAALEKGLLLPQSNHALAGALQRYRLRAKRPGVKVIAASWDRIRRVLDRACRSAARTEGNSRISASATLGALQGEHLSRIGN
ncbi:MAG: hypothetical protein ACM3W4_03275 [Ignavibacteriales bacterium]